MSLFDAFRYDGRRALVVGAASGMGAAAARLLVDAGATVVGMDHAPVDIDGVQGIAVNLADRESIDAAVAECGGPVHALFSCAGVADGTPGIEKINFVGHRYMIDQLVGRDLMPRGSSIGFISSAAGLGWEPSFDELREVLEIADFDEAAAWFERNNKADYMHTKQVICAYVASQAFPMLRRGIRINAICPGPTDTPLAQANKEVWLGFGADYREETGIEASTPEEQAYPLVFLGSDAAVAINGVILVSDAGYMSSGLTESFPAATMIAKLLHGRISLDELDLDALTGD